MRYDLNILWVEDAESYYSETKEILEAFAEENGISVLFHYIQNVEDFFTKIEANQNGFKLYDLFFIDYSLSSGVVGSQLISTLRMRKMDSDILFYSSDNEEVIREIVKNDIGLFEGVYIANKNSFDDISAIDV